MPSVQSLPRHASETDFLSASDAVRLIVRVGITEVLRAMADAIEADFKRWNDFDKSARTAAHSAKGVIELMPVADSRDYAFKYVNGHPGNPQLGLPTVMAFGALADVATGMPRFVSELTLTTALRTAATSAMAARHLARADSRCMALIGNGSQSEFQALAFMALLGVRELRLYDLDRAASHKLVHNLQPFAQQMGVTLIVADSVPLALQGADIVTTATADKARATIITNAMVHAGMHINAIGGDCPGKTELDAALLQRAQVFVEYEPQTRMEGELQQMPAHFAVTELWRVIQGEAPGRSTAEQITIFDSVGFALEDYSALRTMHALAREAGLLSQIELIPTLDDPKNLFSALKQEQAAQQLAKPKAA